MSTVSAVGSVWQQKVLWGDKKKAGAVSLLAPLFVAVELANTPRANNADSTLYICT